ncbi:MAG: glycosyltransferase [Sphaerochaetaceae bacterium]
MSMILSLVIFIIGLYAFILTHANKRYLSDLQHTVQPETSSELVSVLIPARNEEKTIGPCVRSILQQNHKNLEILILDDGSEDHTASVVQSLAQKDSRIRLIQGKPLEKGWRGKLYAMEQLYEESKGAYLLFTDADTIHTPNSITYGLSLLKKHNASLLSGYPKQIHKNIWIELLVSAMLFNPTLFIPFKLQERIQLPLFAMAIGQYLLLKRTALEHMDGFSHIKHEICDDVQLARSCTRFHEKQIFAPMAEVLSCEMFPSFKTAFHGLERSIHGVIKRGWVGTFLILLIVLALLLLAFSPVLTVYFAFQSASLLPCLLSLVGTLLFLAAWIINARFFQFSLKSSFFAHFTIFSIILMYLHGLFLVHTGRGFDWKGRKIS